MDHIYDVIILGAGPAGLSAGLYAGRSRLDTLIIEKGQAGGQIINTDEIENYPGQIVEGETGVSLVRRMYEQTEQFGAEHVRDTITNAELSGDIKVLTGEKDTYQAKNIIIATGAYARPIGCKGEQEYKSTTGQSFNDWKRLLRIQKAERLLVNTQKSVADISEILGYENPETFIRAFKKELHITPAKYRSREITPKTNS